MYAVMEDYQESVIHYSHALRLQPDFDEAKLRRNAVVCQATDKNIRWKNILEIRKIIGADV